MHLSRPPTSFEWTLALHLIAAFMIVLGIAGLVMAHSAPPDRAEAALALEHRAFWMLGIGCAFTLLVWLFRRR